MSNVKTITWNTGALYSREGQIITAEFDFDSGRVIFNDHSRMISGVFRAKLPMWGGPKDELHLQAWVVNQYLHNLYDYDASGDADRLRRVEKKPTAKRVARATIKYLDQKEGTMINHPNRSKRNQPRIKVTLANSGGPLDERIVSAHPDWTDQQIAEVTCRVAADMIRETTFLHPGDTITVTEIER